MGIYNVSAEQRQRMQSEAAAREECERIMGILECAEAQGREAQAKALAGLSFVSVEDARMVLAASPLNAQARTGTALDAMMQRESPAALSGTGGHDSPGASSLSAAVQRLRGKV